MGPVPAPGLRIGDWLGAGRPPGSAPLGCFSESPMELLDIASGQRAHGWSVTVLADQTALKGPLAERRCSCSFHCSRARAMFTRRRYRHRSREGRQPQCLHVAPQATGVRSTASEVPALLATKSVWVLATSPKLFTVPVASYNAANAAFYNECGMLHPILIWCEPATRIGGRAPAACFDPENCLPGIRNS